MGRSHLSSISLLHLETPSHPFILPHWCHFHFLICKEIHPGRIVRENRQRFPEIHVQRLWSDKKDNRVWPASWCADAVMLWLSPDVTSVRWGFQPSFRILLALSRGSAACGVQASLLSFVECGIFKYLQQQLLRSRVSA